MTLLAAGSLLTGCSTVAGVPVREPSIAGTTSPVSTVSTTGTTSAPVATAGPSTPSSTPAEVDGATGAAGIGDPYYPEAGNGGYDVAGYDVAIDYDPATNHLRGRTTVTAKVTAGQRLGRFDLDLQRTMKVSEVTVNGQPAAFEQERAELVITPQHGLDPGAALTVVVTYAGEPAAIEGGTANLGDGGWYRTASGGAVAIGEPFSASAWFPVNEHPADPATFTVTATVPAAWKVISGGLQVTKDLPKAPAGQQVYRWEQRQPIASYLTTIYIDKFTLVNDKLPDGRPIVSAIAPSKQADRDRKLAGITKNVVQVLSKYFGDYPFDAVGGIYTGEAVSFALETATRPVYANWVDEETVVHELAHQWYGDDVMIKRWSDICLNECFASYAPWLYAADTKHADLDATWLQQVDQAVDRPEFWSSPLVDMGAGNEFGSVYTRGPLAMHALRKEMGEKPFFAMLSGWVKTYSGKNASFDDWVGYVNKVAGKDLTPFIDAWFRGTTVPPEQFRHPGGLGR